MLYCILYNKNGDYISFYFSIMSTFISIKIVKHQIAKKHHAFVIDIMDSILLQIQ